MISENFKKLLNWLKNKLEEQQPKLTFKCFHKYAYFILQISTTIALRRPTMDFGTFHLK
jgi:hypothetical protein